MTIKSKIKQFFNADILAYFKPPTKQEIKQQLVNDGLIKPSYRDNVEAMLRETYGNDNESVNYALTLFDDAELIKQQKETERKLRRLGDDAVIQNRYNTDVTETADEGIYGYSTRDEVRIDKGDAEIQRWLKDPKVKASFQVIVGQVFADSLLVEQQGDDPIAEHLAGYMNVQLDEMDGTLRNTLKEGVIVGLSFQNAFFEKISGWAETAEYTGKRIIKKFASKCSGLLEFITDDYDNVKSIHSLINYDEYYHPRRFFTLSFNNMFSNPYGQTVFAGTYKFWKSKIVIFQEMAIYANRFSMPIPTVTYDEGDQEAKAQELSNKLYAGLNIALPEGVKAEFLKALESGSSNPFINILEYLDKQISLGICGIDLSQGSYAADKVIADERSFLVKDLREDIEDAVFEQIIKPLIKDNFDIALYPLKYYPRIKFKKSKPAITTTEMNSAIPVLVQNEIIYPDRLADKNKLRQFYDFDDISADEETDEYIDIEDAEINTDEDEFKQVEFSYVDEQVEDDEIDEWEVNFIDTKGLTNFPNRGDDEPVKLIKSDYPLFDLEFAEYVRLNYPEIWSRGGITRGNKVYRELRSIIKGEFDAESEDFIRQRESWAARHRSNHRLAGIVAQMKWLVIGSQGQRYMKSVIRQEMRLIDADKQEG